MGSEIVDDKAFHLILFLLNVIIFITALIFLLLACFHKEFRSSKRQWFIINIFIGIIIFSIINSIFTMLPLAPTYITDMLAQVCTLQNFLQDVAQGQVAYSLVAFCIHQSGPQQWRNRSFIWFGICVGIQWICSYLLPLPQILMSNLYICLAFLPNQFLPIYSLIFLLVLPIFLHLIIYIIVIIFKNKEITNTQIHPTEYINPTELRYQTSMAYILIMALLFDLIGYGPRGILIIIDPELQQNITTYEALTTLPSFCLIINIGLLYKMNKEIPKKIRSTFRR